jgi:hypothetical protein
MKTEAIDTAMADHVHHPICQQERCFSGCVDPHDCTPAAHGGMTYRDVCSCGAERATNVNGTHEEEGPWCEVES